MILDAVRQHYVDLWGEPAHVIPRRTKDFHFDIYKWDASTHPEEVTMYATLGASVYAQPGYSSDHRLEFYIGLLPEQDGIANVLADIASYPIREQAAIGDTHTITWLEPLWPGTEMCAVLLKRSDVDMIPMLTSHSDGIHVEFLSVAPLYASEVQFKKVHSMDALMKHWWKHNVRFWDPNRLPEPA